jgi:predicted dehydrogenase
MTERHDVLAKLRRRITADRQMFGEFVSDDLAGAAIEIGSKHHLFKRVNGAPLIRPSWYYDVNVQGDGLVDIQSHMTDQMQWLVGEEKDFALDVDVTDLKANRWGTPVPMDLFSDSTGLNEFPNSVEARVTDGVLDLQCNSEVSYTLRGVSVKQAAQWHQREPPGSGDIHAAHFRGTRAELILDHGAQTGFVPRLHVRPREGVTEADLRAGVAQLQGEFPGLGLEASPIGYELTLPDSLRTTHEQHFAMVLNDFLDTLESGEWPATTAARIRMRYALLAKAKRLVDGETA